MTESLRLIRDYETATDFHSTTQNSEGANQQSARSDLSGRNVCVALRSRSTSRAKRNEWSSADLQQLRELAGTGTPLVTIAATLRRTTSAVRNKAGMHGISLRVPR
ncbi:MAG: hypothetical protein SXG53_26795 [Pseudomonadota bacterium]|nr:hypothetical protein [Pseudomonadota bacterium]